MKHIGVRDFRDHATQYLAGGEPVAIQRHGTVIGFYFPVKQDKEATRRALERIDATVDDIIEETGASREELIAAWNAESA